MRKWLLGACAFALMTSVVLAKRVSDGVVLDAMEAVSFSPSNPKAQVSVVPGKDGNALKFAFANEGMNALASSKIAGKPEWDTSAGFSFWVKGDGSDHLGGIEFIWNGDYGIRYAYAFPINSTEWQKVVVSWRDLVPELSKISQPLDPKSGNGPSKLGPLSFGKWWYWRDYAAHSYAIDDVRLEPTIALDNKDYRPAGLPLARTLAKLKAGRPITVITMGDSLTDVNHWTNRQTNWPALLQAQIKRKYNAEATIVNPAMGGTELRHNLVVMPRWTSKTPAPDLVTVFFGFNDWNSGMRGETFSAAQQDAVDRIRRATKGRSDVLILTSCPALENNVTLEELADACHRAAKNRNAGLSDINRAFQAVPLADRARFYASDKVHLGLPGQELVAQTVLNALEQGGR